jgi:hypothetical protein
MQDSVVVNAQKCIDSATVTALSGGQEKGGIGRVDG